VCVVKFQVYLVHKVYIYRTSSYNMHCNFTRDNFFYKVQLHPKTISITHDSQQTEKHKTNRQKDHHTFKYSLSHTRTDP